GQTESYFWRVLFEDPMIVLEFRWYMQHKYPVCVAGGYVFCTFPAGQLQVFRMIQSPEPILAACLPPVNLFPGIFPEFLDPSLTDNVDLDTADSEFVEQLYDHFPGLEVTDLETPRAIESTSFPFINLPLFTTSGSVSAPQDSDPQAEIPMANTSTNTTSANTAIIGTHQYDPVVVPTHAPSGAELMVVPSGLNTRGRIMRFVKWYTSKLPKSVREVRCSLCRGGPNPNKGWEVKPSKLTRHIMTHNGVKWFQCPSPDCGILQFTIRDQGVKHMDKHHPGTPVTALVELDVDYAF
ncbi:hypothetical protein FRC11_009649, partial [Ceratobasidium sp. 423]